VFDGQSDARGCQEMEPSQSQVEKDLTPSRERLGLVGDKQAQIEHAERRIAA
jgi:hypothetical protein